MDFSRFSELAVMTATSYVAIVVIGSLVVWGVILIAKSRVLCWLVGCGALVAWVAYGEQLTIYATTHIPRLI